MEIDHTTQATQRTEKTDDLRPVRDNEPAIEYVMERDTVGTSTSRAGGTLMTQPPHYPTQPPYNRQTPPASPGYPQPSSPTYPQNQAYSTSHPTAPPPKSNTKTGIIITMSVIILALTAAIAYFVFFKNTPTTSTTPSINIPTTPSTNATATPTTPRATPTPGRGWTISGSQLSGPTMTAQLPSGWQISNENGADNDGEIIDPKTYNRITYWKLQSEGSAEAACKSRIERNRMAQDGPVEQTQGQTWGGKTILSYHYISPREQRKASYNLYCLETSKTTTEVLETAGWNQFKAPMLRDTQTVMSSWQWK